MESMSKSALIEFNEEVLSLSKAGIAFDLGKLEHLGQRVQNSAASETTEVFLGRVNAFLESTKISDQSIKQAIAEQFPESPNYCRAVEIYTSTDSRSLALEQLRFPIRINSMVTTTIGNALIYPFILLVFVALGFSVICLFTGPTITSLYDQVQQERPFSVQILDSGRRLLPAWGSAVPLFMVLFWVWWHRAGKSKSWTWLPGNSVYYQAAIKSHSAHLLGQLLSKGCPSELAIHLATPQQPTFASHPDTGGKAMAADPLASLPPLMQWAMQRSDHKEKLLQDTLPVVSEIYAKTAVRQTRAWWSLLPTIIGILLGGLVVFAYSFSLFAPVIQVLHDLASPIGGLSDP